MTSLLAVLAAVSVRTVRSGPAVVASSPLDAGAAVRALARHRPLRLATLSYLGHMWELYALWSWLSAFFVAARVMHRPGLAETGAVTFLAIGVSGGILRGRCPFNLSPPPPAGRCTDAWLYDVLGLSVVLEARLR